MIDRDLSRSSRLLIAVAASAVLILAGLGFGLLIAGRASPVSFRVTALQAPSVPNPAVPVQMAQQATNGRYYSLDERNNIAIYEALNEGVVNVAAVTSNFNGFRPFPRSGSGSGVIINSAGHVLTSYHVIKGAARLSVTLWDGSEHDATLVGADPENDLAVIYFDPGDMSLTVIPFGDSTDLRVGQKVLAIGNPFGQDRSLTTGIVSGLSRPVQADDGRIIQEMIQTDASINPGNSGGPLLDASGHIIGINTMIFSPTGVSIGVGFAVPISTARRVLPELMEHGTVRRGWIDIQPIPLDSRLGRQLGLRRSDGLLISTVKPDSLAAMAGLRGGTRQIRWGRSVFWSGGDIIVEVDGMQVTGFADLLAALEDNKPGEVVQVVVDRRTRLYELSVTLGERRR